MKKALYLQAHFPAIPQFPKPMAAEKPRLARLTAILTQLKTKRVVTAQEMANKHAVSIRTIYRDIRTLEKSGVPVITEEGKGYSLMQGYTIPPIMFTEEEAFALVTAEQLILQNNDTSLIKHFTEATAKIKAVLKGSLRAQSELLQEKIIVRLKQEREGKSNYLSVVQLALSQSRLIRIAYTDDAHKKTLRTVEPFSLYNAGKEWLLIAYCRLRTDFRTFRFDRISQLEILQEQFQPQKMTYAEFIQKHYGTPDTRLS